MNASHGRRRWEEEGPSHPDETGGVWKMPTQAVRVRLDDVLAVARQSLFRRRRESKREVPGRAFGEHWRGEVRNVRYWTAMMGKEPSSS